MQIDVQRAGKRFDAQAVIDLPADAPTVWAAITDYASLPEFMPGIRSCRVVEQGRQRPDGTEQLVVEQLGEFRFLLFSQAIRTWLNVEHRPLKVATAHATRFDLGLLKHRVIDRFEGRYELQEEGGRRSGRHVKLHYTALIQLHMPPPPAVGSIAVKRNLTDQLTAISREVARRTRSRLN